MPAEPAALVQLPKPLHTRSISSQPVSLSQAILLGMRTNPDVINARLDRVVQKFSLLVAQNAFQPQYKLKASLGRENLFSRQVNTQSTLSPTITVTNQIGTQFLWQATGTYTSPVDGKTARSSTSKISVTQPLMRGAGQVASYPLMDAEANEQLNKLLYRNNVMTQITAIISSYHNLVKSDHSVTINRMALQDSIEQLEHYKLRVKVGQAAGSELLTQQSQVATQRLTLASSQNQLQRAKQSLLGLLGLNPNMDFRPESNIYREQITQKIPSKERAIGLALAQSSAYQTALTKLAMAKRALKKAQDDMRWELNATAQTQIIHGIDGQQTSSATGDKSLTLNLSIPIDDVNLKNSLLDAEVDLESKRLAVKTARQAVESQVINQMRDLVSQEEQVKMARQAVLLAQRTLRQARLKLAYGRASAFEVASLREELTIKQLAEVNAKITYLDTYASFHQTIGLTLKDWDIKIEH